MRQLGNVPEKDYDDFNGFFSLSQVPHGTFFFYPKAQNNLRVFLIQTTLLETKIYFIYLKIIGIKIK